jgi:hypothetical protein
MQTKDVLGTRYRLDQRIAVGGMGDVWAARDELLGRQVALKLLHPNLAADDEFRRRFRAEAKTAARLSHPGIVAVYDYGEDPDAAYLAMELVDGEPLSALIRRRGRLNPAETMSLVAQAAEALAAAHTEGLVHRDVKPANLLLRTDGRLKVTDFGIVRAADTSTLTRDGTVFGTVAYMSPEQVRGERATAASDIYSLGVVAYECLGGSLAVALGHLHDPVPPLPDDVPEGVRRLVLRMLEKNPGDRPASAGAVANTAKRLAADGDATWALGGLGGAATDLSENGRRGEGATDRYEAGPPTVQLTQAWDPDERSESMALAGLAEPHTMALALPRPATFRTGSPNRHWASVAAVTAAALVVALLFAAAFSGGPTHAKPGIALPQLRGMTLGAAEQRLASLGLHATLSPGNPSPLDIVVGEHPSAGHRVKRGSGVALTLRAPVVHTTTTTTPRTAPTSPAKPAPGPPPAGPPGHGGTDGPPGHGGGDGGPGGH